MSGGIYYICVNRHKCALVPISLGGVKLCGCETRRGNINVGGRNWTDCRASKGNHQFYSPALDIHVHKNVFFFLLSLFVLIPYTERISGIRENRTAHVLSQQIGNCQVQLHEFFSFLFSI